MGCGTSTAAASAGAHHLPVEQQRREKSGQKSATRPANEKTMTSAIVEDQSLIDQAGFRGSSANSDRSVDSGLGSETKDGQGREPSDHLQAELSKQAALLRTTVANKPLRVLADEQMVMESLRQEGLLGSASTSTTKGGLCFEVSVGELKVRSRRPPARLQKLERLEQPGVLSERVREKLSSAEARRKKRELDKVQRSKDKDAKNLEVKLASLELDKGQGNKSSDRQLTSVAEGPEAADQPLQKQLQQRKIISARIRARTPSANLYKSVDIDQTVSPPV